VAKMNVELNRRNIGALLKDPALGDRLEALGQRVAAAAGPGHETELWRGRNRYRVTVRSSHPTNTAGHARLRAAMQAGRSLG
jgi:hypothetical protein